MTTIVIENQSDIDQLYREIALDWLEVEFRTALEDELTKLEEIHAGYFNSRSGPDGNEWPALAASTVQRKGHDTILVETGRLRRDLTQSGAGLREVVEEPAGAGFVFGTDATYSVFHDTESDTRPARRHVGMTLEHTDAIAGRMLDVALEDLQK